MLFLVLIVLRVTIYILFYLTSLTYVFLRLFLVFLALFALIDANGPYSVVRKVDSLKQLNVVNATYPVKGVYECTACVSFMNSAINNLIQIIADVGIGGGCSAVCGLLPAAWEQTACTIICEIVGIEEFANLINEEDPDPIFICMYCDLCPIALNAKGQITNVACQPPSGPQGTTFTISTVYKVTSAVGTGQILLVVIPPGNAEAFGDDQLLVSQGPGTYNYALQFQAQPQQGEPFQPGVYVLLSALCEGTCGSIHSYSYTIAEARTTFRITG